MKLGPVAGVYSIRCLGNGRLYIGSSKDLDARWYSHKQSLSAGKHWNAHLQRAWKKYGAAEFVFETVECCSEKERLEVEQYYLDHVPRRQLFNLSKIARCPESTVAVRAGRSERAKAQHAAGTLGRKTWKTDSKIVIAKSVATRRRNGTQIIPSFEWTPERRERVAVAMRARRAREKEAGLLPPSALCKWEPAARAKAAERMRALHVRYPDLAAANVGKAGHQRWHVKRGIVNPTCRFCAGDPK